MSDDDKGDKKNGNNYVPPDEVARNLEQSTLEALREAAQKAKYLSREESGRLGLQQAMDGLRVAGQKAREEDLRKATPASPLIQ